MPEKRLKELLGELRTELKGVDGVDDEVMESLEQLEVNIDDLVDPFGRGENGGPVVVVERDLAQHSVGINPQWRTIGP